MCPICWATALTTYMALLAISAVTVAGTDKWSLIVSALLGTLSVGHWTGWLSVPWWCLAAMGGGLVLRIGYLLLTARERLLVAQVWRLALATAQRHCPKRGRPAP